MSTVDVGPLPAKDGEEVLERLSKASGRSDGNIAQIARELLPLLTPDEARTFWRNLRRWKR